MRNQLKIRVAVLMLFFIQLIQAQVGINESNPKLSLDINASSASNSSEVFTGMRAPRITGNELNAKIYTADHDGAIVFVTLPASIKFQIGQTIDVKYQGYYYFDIDAVSGGKWIRWFTTTKVSSVNEVQVSAQSLDGVYVGGENLDASHKVSFRITNNSFQPINNIDFSNDVTVQNGNATITVDGSSNTSVSLAPGSSQVLTYQLSGVPEVGVLTAKFDKTLGNLHAEISTAVSLLNTTANIYKKYLVSFSYNGTEFQGKINNSTEKVTLEIPYNRDLGFTDAVSVTETSAAGEGGDVNDLTLTIPAGNYYNSPVATVTITVGGDGEYLIKKQAPGQQYTIATFNFSVSGKSYTIELIGIGGIPDRRFGDSSGHDFVYSQVEVTGIVTDNSNANPQAYNKTWLNMNLGATYSDMNHSDFNPTITKYAVDAHSDSKLKGSIFQWQRPADGHDLVNWDTNPVSVKPTTNTLATSWVPGHDDFIVSTEQSNYNWNTDASVSQRQLWQSGGANNPCPVGFHVPTKNEFNDLIQVITGARDGAFDNSFYTTQKIPNLTSFPGRYNQGGQPFRDFSGGRFWSSSYDSSDSSVSFVTYDSEYVTTGFSYPGFAFAIRCVKN